ncbi:thyrotropin-releasing hormone receptor-like [Lineus longissimus]|uniref:thyrotropin-releasing hormone receptor-like n=1 Tax=Lineus longissimus TaxID=88925 RepID=UPI00315C90CE
MDRMETTESSSATGLPGSAYAALMQQILDVTQGYVMLGIYLIGFFGNTLSLVVFFRLRRREDACVQYLSCLAVSDNGVIIFLGVSDWIAVGLKFLTDGAVSFNFMSHTGLTCKIQQFVSQYFMCVSAWTIAAFSAERAFVVLHPLKRVNITATFRRKVICLIWFSAVTAGIHHLVLMNTIPGTPVLCYYDAEPTTAAILWLMDTILFCYAPSFLIFVSNILILVAIFKSRKSSGRTARQTHQTSNEGRLLVSLMLVSTLFIIFVLPANTTFAYLADMQEKLTEDEALFLYYIVKFLTLVAVLNYCINFIIYGCTMPEYRQDVSKIFSGVANCLIKTIFRQYRNDSHSG